MSTPSMQATQLLEALKQHLKRQGIGYQQLAEKSGMSLVSVKRWLNRPSLELDKLLQLCHWVGLELNELCLLAEQNREAVYFSENVEQVLEQEPALFDLYTAIITGCRRLSELEREFDLDPASCYLYVRKLEQLELVQLNQQKIRLCWPLKGISGNGSFGKKIGNLLLDAIRQNLENQGKEEGGSSKHGHHGMSATILLLNDGQYAQLKHDLNQIVEQYGRYSKQYIHQPSQDAKVRTLVLNHADRNMLPKRPIPRIKT